MKRSTLAIIIVFSLSAMTAQAQYTTTKSGLQYRIDNPGNNRHPQKGWRVWLEYTGRLDDGTIFGSTDETGKYLVFLLAFCNNSRLSLFYLS